MDECSEAVRMNYSCGINANFASPNFDFDANNGTWAAAFKHLKTFQIGQYMNHHWKLIETSLLNCHCNSETICSQVKRNIKAVIKQRESLWSLSDQSANRQIVGREVGGKKENEKEEFDRQVKSPSGREGEEGKGKYQKPKHLHEDVSHHSWL